MSTQTGLTLLLLGISLFYFFWQPKNINLFYGYRTKLSRKNQKNWEVGNKTASKYLLIFSSANFILSLITDQLQLDFKTALGVIIVVELIILFYLTEKKLSQL